MPKVKHYNLEEMATEKQLAYLEILGADPMLNYTKKDAQDLISKLVEERKKYSFGDRLRLGLFKFHKNCYTKSYNENKDNRNYHEIFKKK